MLIQSSKDDDFKSTRFISVEIIIFRLEILSIKKEHSRQGEKFMSYLLIRVTEQYKSPYIQAGACYPSAHELTRVWGGASIHMHILGSVSS